jgi:hypothetical protein
VQLTQNHDRGVTPRVRVLDLDVPRVAQPVDQGAVFRAVPHTDEDAPGRCQGREIACEQSWDLRQGHIVQRLAEQDHVECAVWAVGEDVADDVGGARRVGSPCNRHGGEIHSDIRRVATGRQLAGGRPVTTPQVQQRSAAQVGLDARIQVVVRCLRQALPLSPRKFAIPDGLANGDGRVAFQPACKHVGVAFLWLLVGVCLLAPAPLSAANHYIRDGGSASTSGTGACTSWVEANACDTLPATLVRGDTYFVADGAYGTLALAVLAGTSTVTIKKATVADHGTSTGWLDSYGDGQATFTGINNLMGNLTFDGQVGQWASDLPGYVAYGFVIAKNSSAANAVVVRNGNSSATPDNVTFRHVRMHFSNTPGVQAQWALGQDVIYDQGTNTTCSYCWLHDAGRVVYFKYPGKDVAIIEYSVIERNGQAHIAGVRLANGGAEHSEAVMFRDNSDNNVIRYSYVRDWRSTGGVILYHNNKNIRIYGNVFAQTGYFGPSDSNGMINGLGAATGTEVRIYNNTFVDIDYGGILLSQGSFDLRDTRNNIFYDVNRAAAPGVSISGTHDYNWFFASGTHSESNQQNGSGDPFVNRASKDYRLAAGTTAGDASTYSAYNTDLNGVTRATDGTWDRGAFEFDSGGAPANITPTVTITVPTSSATYSTDTDPLATLTGLASDSDGTISGCTGSSDRTGAFSVTGTTVPSATNVDLETGANVLTVVCTDDDGATGSDVLTVTLEETPPEPTAPSDDFNRADASTLGGNWTDQRTSLSPDIISNRVGTTTSGAHVAFWNASTVADNQYAQITLVTIGTSPSKYIGLTCRNSSDTGDSAYDQYQFNTNGNSGSGNTQLNKIVNGTLTVLTYYTATWVSGDVMRIECTGGATTVLKMFKNGTQLVRADGSGLDTYSDASSALTTGQPGVYSFGNGARGDDWQAGEVTGSDTTIPSVAITAPNAGVSYVVAEASTTALAGTASDDVAVSAVTWTCATCTPTSGTASYAAGAWTETDAIGLAEGDNTIIVTATDSSANDSTTDSITITRETPVTPTRPKRLRVR